ncbi:hypothetical protein D3C87_2116940 [compost metagenome]
MGKHSSANAVAGFEHRYVHILLLEGIGSGQPGKPATDHDHAGLFANMNASECVG